MINVYLMTVSEWVAGVDGAQKGWLVACLPIVHGEAAFLRRFETFREVDKALTELNCSAIGVDMPIGLQLGPTRKSDIEARKRLGSRRSTLFPTPSSVVLEATSYEDALQRSREQTEKGISIQTWNLVPQIREVRNVIRPQDSDRYIECHPESSFVEMAGYPLASKKTEEGVQQRTTLLREVVTDLEEIVETLPKKCRIDDALDAFAAAWSAMRYANGTATILGDGEYDHQGYPMRIVI